MWFLFGCDWEAGRCAQWCVVLINLQHLNLSQADGDLSPELGFCRCWAVFGYST